jgi:hypothetical protein
MQPLPTLEHDPQWAIEATNAIAEITHLLDQYQPDPPPMLLCPVDGCALAHQFEPCPQCAYRTAVEPCLACGELVSPWVPCPRCARYRRAGRRPLVHRPIPDAEVA